MYLWMSMQRTELAVNQKISHKISGHRDEEYLSDFSARRKYSLNIIQAFCLHLFHFIISYPNVSMQHESMPHFLRLKLLMIFMGSLLSRHSAWARPPWSRDCERAPCRQEGSTKWLCLVTALRSLYSRVALDKPFHPSPVLNIVPWSQALMVAQIWMCTIYCHLSQIKANQTPHLHHAGQAAGVPLSLPHSTQGHIYGFM